MTTPAPVLTYAPRLVRCNVTATTINGETVVNTIWMQTDAFAGFGSVELVDVANRVRDAWTTMLVTGFNGSLGINDLFHSQTVWRTVSAYAVDSRGRATNQGESTFLATAKGSGASTQAPQVAIVVTTLSGVPGRSGRGRIFLGGLSNASMGSDARIAVGARDRIAQAVGGMYQQARNAPFQSDVIRPVIVSPTTGQARRIRAVTVGDVFDTMRSRRNRYVEARFRQTVDE